MDLILCTRIRYRYRLLIPKLLIQLGFDLGLNITNYHNSFTLKFFQTYMSFFLLLNTNKYILKNVDNQTVVSHLLP